MQEELTIDALLNRSVQLQQPRRGFRAGSDAVLLAAAVPARAGEDVLDVGAGAGAAALCLAWRCRDVKLTAFELQNDLAGLATRNAALNGMEERVVAVAGDIRQPPAAIKRQRFHHVMCNPPFYPDGSASRSPSGDKATAHIETAPLSAWVDFCLRRTLPGGSVTFVHRSDRLPELLAGFVGRAGSIVICPLWSRASRPAKRVIVQALVGARGPTILHPGIVLHGKGGGDTVMARRLLRDGAALKLRQIDSG